MGSTEFRWFFVGTFALAVVLGALIGVSASPVVGVAVPLLFALLSAGGALYIVLGEDQQKPAETPADAAQVPAPVIRPLSAHQRRQRAAFLGVQLIVFSLGIIPGLYAGVWAKIHSDSVWGTVLVHEASIVDLDFTDPRDLAATMVLNERLIAEHVSLPARTKLLTSLHQAISKRRDSTTLALSSDDSAAAESVLKSLPKAAKPAESRIEEKLTEDKESIGPVAVGPDDPTSAAHTTT